MLVNATKLNKTKWLEKYDLADAGPPVITPHPTMIYFLLPFGFISNGTHENVR